MLKSIINYLNPMNLVGCEEAISKCDKNFPLVSQLWAEFLRYIYNPNDNIRVSLQKWKDYAKAAYPNYSINGICSIECFASMWNSSNFGGQIPWSFTGDDLDCVN